MQKPKINIKTHSRYKFGDEIHWFYDMYQQEVTGNGLPNVETIQSSYLPFMHIICLSGSHSIPMKNHSFVRSVGRSFRSVPFRSMLLFYFIALPKNESICIGWRESCACCKRSVRKIFTRSSTMREWANLVNFVVFCQDLFFFSFFGVYFSWRK